MTFQFQKIPSEIRSDTNTIKTGSRDGIDRVLAASSGDDLLFHFATGKTSKMS